MDRRLNKKEMRRWKDSFEDPDEAYQLIAHTLECSLSKAQKIVRGSYPSLPVALEQIAIAGLMGLTRDAVYTPVSKRAKLAS